MSNVYGGPAGGGMSATPGVGSGASQEFKTLRVTKQMIEDVKVIVVATTGSFLVLTFMSLVSVMLVPAPWACIPLAATVLHAGFMLVLLARTWKEFSTKLALLN